ncbi:bifunctional 2',3'-cyclic-nucleotide 2'-phosphodiesterase/3'-nucleotidase [Gymnodinialimonas hymeniacidonis]|uniref:bifunctional 2',3'-cyclic-nucleotide 2'-phosphodiesterase/3'-nucleotidase n=1 Tax=Gymnodinialimonas hymeniacidonis TaxID=3126508 RepID=UPI0034C6C8EB
MTLIGATMVSKISAGPDQVHLRLLATTDLHAHLLPFDYFTDTPTSGVGLAQLADLIRAARKNAPNTLLFDNGDTLQGTPLADATFAEVLPNGDPNPMIVAMNGLGFDAATLGNHDFDFGLDYLQMSLSAARFQLTLANVHQPDGSPFLPERTLLKRRVTDGSGREHELQVGITGVVPPQVAAWSKPSVDGKLRFSDMTMAAATQVAALRDEGADVVVVLAHSGLGQKDAAAGAENTASQIAALPGVDAVFAGHTHDLFSHPGEAGRAPLVQPGAYGSHLGLIDLILEPARDENRWSVKPAQSATPSLPARVQDQDPQSTHLLSDLPDVRSQVDEAHRITRTHVDRPLGHSAVPLETLFSTIAPCAATQVIADAQRAAALPLIAAHPELSDLPILSAAAPFRAGGRAGPENYTDIPAGDLKLRHAADLYIYPNSLCVLRINGAGLLQWLERSGSIYNQIDPTATEPQKLINHSFAPYNFDRITGLTYQIDVSQPPQTDPEGHHVDEAASRIRNLRFEDGRAVGPADEMLIVTNSYRAAGGGHFPSAAQAIMVKTSSISVRDAVAKYIAQSEQSLAPTVQPSFSLTPLGGVDLLFETGPAAEKHKNRQAQLGLRAIEEDEDKQGFTPFLLTL